jgi:hypothetical protein
MQETAKTRNHQNLMQTSSTVKTMIISKSEEIIEKETESAAPAPLHEMPLDTTLSGIGESKMTVFRFNNRDLMNSKNNANSSFRRNKPFYSPRRPTENGKLDPKVLDHEKIESLSPSRSKLMGMMDKFKASKSPYPTMKEKQPTLQKVNSISSLNISRKIPAGKAPTTYR